MTYEEAKDKLADCHQEHILRFYDELDAAGQKALLAQIADIDFTVCENAQRLGEPEERGTFAP